MAFHCRVSHYQPYWEVSCSKEVFCRPSTAPVVGAMSISERRRVPFHSHLWLGKRLIHYVLTFLVVTLNVTEGRAKMQKTVTPRLTLRTDSETDGHGGVITVALHCVVSVVKLTIQSSVSISHASCLPCLIDTISCSNRCMLTLYCLIGHSIVISRRPTMRYT